MNYTGFYRKIKVFGNLAIVDSTTYFSLKYWSTIWKENNVMTCLRPIATRFVSSWLSLEYTENHKWRNLFEILKGRQCLKDF